MKKPFLLIVGFYHYPSKGTGDWIGTYESYEEAEAEIKPSGKFFVLKNDSAKYEYDWYEIIDLRDLTK